MSSESEQAAWLAGERSVADAMHYVANPEFEAMEVDLYKHQPVLSMEDGSIAGCACMDRVFNRDSGEDWGTHLAEIVEAEIANRAGVVSVQGEPEEQGMTARGNTRVTTDQSIGGGE